jgi:peptide/nickel transport system permease protein
MTRGEVSGVGSRVLGTGGRELVPPTPETRHGPRSGGRPDWRRALRPLLRNGLVVAGLIIVLWMVLTALLAGPIAPRDPAVQDIANSLKPPSAESPFGTDRFGRDILSRVIYGSRISLWVSVASVTISIVVGSILGLISGYLGGWVDNLISRIMDVFFAFPGLFLAIAIAAILGPGMNNALLAIAVVYAPFFSRVVRGPVLAERVKEYVEAARVIGANAPQVILRHILPNVLSPVIVQGSVIISQAILIEASLSYLGLGTQPPDPSWGTMLNEGRTFLEIAPWMSIFPGLAIMLAVLGFNLFGDGLRDVLDPKAR